MAKADVRSLPARALSSPEPRLLAKPIEGRARADRLLSAPKRERAQVPTAEAHAERQAVSFQDFVDYQRDFLERTVLFWVAPAGGQHARASACWSAAAARLQIRNLARCATFRTSRELRALANNRSRRCLLGGGYRS